MERPGARVRRVPDFRNFPSDPSASDADGLVSASPLVRSAPPLPPRRSPDRLPRGFLGFDCAYHSDNCFVGSSSLRLPAGSCAPEERSSSKPQRFSTAVPVAVSIVALEKPARHSQAGVVEPLPLLPAHSTLPANKNLPGVHASRAQRAIGRSGSNPTRWNLISVCPRPRVALQRARLRRNRLGAHWLLLRVVTHIASLREPVTWPSTVLLNSASLRSQRTFVDAGVILRAQPLPRSGYLKRLWIDG